MTGFIAFKTIVIINSLVLYSKFVYNNNITSLKEGIVMKVFDQEYISPKQPFFVISANRYYKYILNQFGIVHFYCRQTGNSEVTGAIAIPDGCVDILFCCDNNHPSAFVCGTVLEPTLTMTQKNTYYFGVRFMPGYNPVIEKKNVMSTLISNMVPFEELIKDTKMFEKIVSSRDFMYQIKTFLDYYIEIYNRTNSNMNVDTLSRFVVSKIILSSGNVNLENLASLTGYSTRYIHKIFTSDVGIPPKTFSNIIRFQRLISTLNKPVLPDFASIAADIGYFDQSHMLKEFKAFTGTTPKKYISSLSDVEYTQKLIIL